MLLISSLCLGSTPPAMMRILGHRGLAWNHPTNPYPENTIASLEAAVAAGAMGVEIDLVLTADGVLVLRHDDILSIKSPFGGQSRSNCRGRISQRNYSTLSKCKAQSHGRLPGDGPIARLDEALRLSQIDLWVLDLKDDARTRGPEALVAAATALEDAGLKDDAVLMLYKKESIAAAKHLGLRACLKRHRRKGLTAEQIAAEVQSAGAWGSCANAEIVDAPLMKALKERGLKQISYLLGDTVNSRWDRKLRHLSAIGVHAVITDQITRANRLTNR